MNAMRSTRLGSQSFQLFRSTRRAWVLSTSRNSHIARPSKGTPCSCPVRSASKRKGDLMPASVLELDDIQSGVLRPRPTPYVATYILFRIDERKAGRELMRRLSGTVSSAAHPENSGRDTWVSAAVTFQGLKALGVSQSSLNSFSP